MIQIRKSSPRFHKQSAIRNPKSEIHSGSILASDPAFAYQKIKETLTEKRIALGLE